MLSLMRTAAPVVAVLVFFTPEIFAEVSNANSSSSEPFLTVCAVGDIHMGTDYPSDSFLPPDRGETLFLPVIDLLVGDVVFGNLEGPLIDGGETDKCSSSQACFAFRTPTTYVRHLKKAGFNVLSLANNHAMDFGEAGRQSTIQALESAGIFYTGPPGRVAKLTVHGRQLAVIAFATAEHSYNLLDIDQASQTVARLKQENDLVVVSFHGGSEGAKVQHVVDKMEYLGSEPRGSLIQFAHAVVDAGADLVIGHGPHVLRGMEVYRRRLIVYSLGNFCTYGRFNLEGVLGQSVVLETHLNLDSGHFVEGRLHAMFQTKLRGPRPDPEHRGIRLVRELSEKDFPFSAPLFGPRGQLLAPPGEGSGLFSIKEPKDRRRFIKVLEAFSKQGIDRGKLRRWFGDSRASIVPAVLERMSRPAERLPYQQYRTIFINQQVINAGLKFFNRHKKLLTKVEKRFGVDRQVLLGLVGVESRFGNHRGAYRAFNALSTLAIKHPRRAGWAQRELKALLMQFSVDPLSIMGSYAGAIGLVQFMPTSIQSYGVDFNADGIVNLEEWQDALASAANYLEKHGWQRAEPIRRGSANYRAIFRYNPDHNYVRVVKELSGVLGRRTQETVKNDKTKNHASQPDPGI